MEMGKRFIRVNVVLFLLLLVALEAGQGFKRQTSEQEGDKDISAGTAVAEAPGKEAEIPSQEESDRESKMSVQDENDSQENLPDLEKQSLETHVERTSDAGDMKEIEVYREVLEEYAQAIREDADEVYAVGKWKYVYDVLYYAGKEDGILYYSLENLSNHENRELIVGRLYDGEYTPYAIYREWGAGVEFFIIAERYKMFIYEGGIVELVGGGISCPIMYWTVGEEVTIETLEMKVEGGKIVGYTREIFLGSHESIKEEITKEEYLEIIEQYTAVPAELEWMPLEGF